MRMCFSGEAREYSGDRHMTGHVAGEDVLYLVSTSAVTLARILPSCGGPINNGVVK